MPSMMQAMSDEFVMFHFWPYDFKKADSLQFALDFSPAYDSWDCILWIVVYNYPNQVAVRKLVLWYVDKLSGAGNT